MSHTSTVDAIVVTDVEALKCAVRELNSAGVKCSILENATPRAFYATQNGMGEAPYVIKLDDAKYDVGVYKRDDNTGYEFRTDFYGGSVQAVLGAAGGPPNNLGKLCQMYAVHAVTRKAAQQGMSVSRVSNSNGGIKLVINDNRA